MFGKGIKEQGKFAMILDDFGWVLKILLRDSKRIFGLGFQISPPELFLIFCNQCMLWCWSFFLPQINFEFHNTMNVRQSRCLEIQITVRAGLLSTHSSCRKLLFLFRLPVSSTALVTPPFYTRRMKVCKNVQIKVVINFGI